MTLRVGLLGCGGIGARHAKAAGQLAGEMVLVACCGREMGKTEAFAAEYRATPFADFAHMIDTAKLDLLIVALPPFAHDGQVELAARAGVNLLVEKPIALNMDRANAMVAASADVIAACGFMYRFGAATMRWDEAMAAGETGSMGHFSGQFHCNALHAPWWRSREKAGGQMVEQLIHIIDLARHTLGEPQTVYARAANLFHGDVPGYTGEDVSAIILGYEDSRIGVLHAGNAAIPGKWMKHWQIVAERMTGLFTDFNEAQLFHTQGEIRGEVVKSDRDVFVAQLADVAAAIRDMRAPMVPLSDGARSLAIALAARQSADERREVVM